MGGEKPKQDVIILASLQITLVVLFCIFCRYNTDYDIGKYGMFHDVHVMIFVGFGFLMTFLRRYGYSSVGFNFLLGSIIVEWACVCLGFYKMSDDYKILISMESLYQADIASAAVLISMGAVLGQTSYMQLIIMGIIEIAAYSANAYLGLTVYMAVDAGGSIFVHTFGAYFGLAVSFVLNKRKIGSVQDSQLEESSYSSDLFAMIGTIFLWLYWPSFNSVELSGDEQHRAVINTYLSLASCCVTSFLMSQILSEDHKFDMVHIQNSTLAGGVAVGTCANLMIQPYGAVLVGIAAGSLSVVGYVKITPMIEKLTGIHDTCGVHNLHGMPGVLAGLFGVLMAGLASESLYNDSLYEIYPALSSPTSKPGTETGVGLRRTPAGQAGYQILALVTTMVVAVVAGLITGFILTHNGVTSQMEKNYQFNDSISWNLPRDIEQNPKIANKYDNAAFAMETVAK